MSCDQAILVDQATDASLSSDAVQVEIGRLGQRLQRRGAMQGPVRPVLIVVRLVVVQNPPQMGLVPDETSQGFRCQAARGLVCATAFGQATASLICPELSGQRIMG